MEKKKLFYRYKSHCTICPCNAYCILHRFRSGIFCLRTSGLILQNKSHPDSNKSLFSCYHQATGLQFAPDSFMGIFRYTLPAGVKLLRRCRRFDGTLLCALDSYVGQCFNLHLVTMMQNGQITQMASILTLDRKHDGPDFRHRLPGSRLSSVQQAQGRHAQTGHSPCPGFHRMAAMLEYTPCGSVLSGR